MEDARTVRITELLQEGVTQASQLGHVLSPWHYSLGIQIIASCIRCGADAKITLLPALALDTKSIALYGPCLPNPEVIKWHEKKVKA